MAQRARLVREALRVRVAPAGEWLATAWSAPRVVSWRARAAALPGDPRAGAVVLVAGTLAITLLILGINAAIYPVPNPGLIYLPLVAMLAYHWDWRYGATAGLLQLACVYILFQRPAFAFKQLGVAEIEQLLTLAAVSVFILALVQLARDRRASAEHEAGRFAALNAVGRALTSELEEDRLLDVIARTARDVTNAQFAAFTLRPVDAFGEPQVPSEGNRFHLAAVVGVSLAEEALFRQMPLGGSGLLEPIFHQGMPVRVADALALPRGTMHGYGYPVSESEPETGSALERHGEQHAHGSPHEPGHPSEIELRTGGFPHGHPIARSFLGAPLFDRQGRIRGGLLLGHAEPDRFTLEDETLLLGLAAQASVALENARLFHAAQTQAQELDMVFESITDGVTLVDRAGVPVRENRAARVLRERLEAAPRAEAARAALLEEPARAALSGGQEAGATATVALTDAQGEAREYLVTAAPLRAPEGSASPTTGAVVVWHDATEARRLLAERQARAEAEARRALLQLVIAELPSGIFLVRGSDARLVLANREAMEVLGADWPEGMSLLDFLAQSGTQVFAPNGRLLAPDELATLSAVRTGKPVRHHQEIIRQAGGTALPILLNAVALDASIFGAPTTEVGDPERAAAGDCAALVVLQDMTALKEAERVKDEFIAIAAHELKNPMAAIKGYANMLTRNADGDTQLPDWQREAVETIDQATGRLVELTDDLLDVTRLQAGRIELHREPHDLIALVRRVVRRLQVTSERHTLEIHAEAEYVVGEVDVQRIEQVVTNLLNNAVKYSPEGGRVEVTITEDQTAGEAHVAIADQGIGIPTDQQARIFSRFARADNARERGITGTGLGLYLSRELIERHGGRIWFESTVGYGSTFYITLPLADDAEES
jgi:signal transduction histidine kinase